MAAAEQGLLARGLDSLLAPIPSPEPSALPAAAVAASAQIEDSKPSTSPAAAVAVSTQLEDAKAPSSPPSAAVVVSAHLEEPLASPVAVGGRAKLPRLRPVIKLASWPVHRVFHGIGRACDFLVSASRRPIVVRCVAKISALIPDLVRSAASRVLLLLDSLPTGSQELPISDPVLEHLYIRPDMEHIGLLLLALVATGAVLFITLEVLVMTGFVTRYDQYVIILRNVFRFLQGLLEAVSKISGFYGNVKWHLAKVARMRQEAAEQQLHIPTPASKQQLPPLASEKQPPPPATDS